MRFFSADIGNEMTKFLWKLIRFLSFFLIVYNRDEYQSTLVLMKRIFYASDLFRMACGVYVHKPFEVSWCMPEKCQYCAKIFYLKITWNAWAIDAKKIIWKWKKNYIWFWIDGRQQMQITFFEFIPALHKENSKNYNKRE